MFELVWNGPGLSGFPNSYVFSQPELEAVLNSLALKNPLISVHRGQEVTSFTQDDDGVTLHTDGDWRSRPVIWWGRTALTA